jgi:AsmA family protein
VSIRTTARILKLLLIIATAAVITLFISLNNSDFDHYRRDFATTLSAATGRKVSIDGKVSLDFVPGPALRMTKVRVANAPWGSRPAMVTVDEFAAQIAIWPLLMGGTVRFNNLVFRGVDVLLETDKNGRRNWDLSAAGNDETPAAPGIDFREVTLEGIAVTYRESQDKKGVHAAVQRFSLKPDRDGALQVQLDASYGNEKISVVGTVGALGKSRAGGQPWPVALEGSAAGATFSVKGKIADPYAGAGIDVEVQAQSRNLADLSRWLGLKPWPEKPFRYAGRVRGKTTAGPYRLEKFELAYGNSTLRGDAHVETQGARPKIDGRLANTDLDLADIGIRLGRPAGAAADRRLFSMKPLLLDELFLADADLAIENSQARLGKLPLLIQSGRLALDDGRLQVTSQTGEVGGGRFAGAFIIESQRSGKVLTVSLDFRQVEIAELIKTVNDKKLASGKTDGRLSVRGAGRSWHEIMKSLDGVADLAMDRGYVVGDEIDMIADLLPSLSPGNDVKKGSDIVCFVGRLNVADGVATTTTWVLDTSRASVQAAGVVNLGDESIDLVLKPHSREAKLMTVAVPLHIFGNLSDPTIAPDQSSVAAGVAGAVASTALGPVGLLIPLINALSGTSESTCPAARTQIRRVLKQIPGVSPAPARQ